MLLAALPFGGRLSARRVAEAIAEGMAEAGLADVDIAALRSPDPLAVQAARRTPDSAAPATGLPAAGTPACLQAIDFDSRMRAARAVVIAADRLDERTLLGSLPFEIATRCRQAGVPTYAVTRENALAPFDARILDLQRVLDAGSMPALRRAGAALAEIV